MPKSKRKTTRNPAPAQHTSDVDLPESSPSGPSAKRRKVNGTRTSARRKATPELEPADELPSFPDSDNESETVSQGDLVDTVISYLSVSREPVAAVSLHSNELSTDSSKIKAYAKIAGRNWTYYIREQSINIGRPPDDRQAINGVGASSPLADLKEILPVHIDLGPSKIVSRHHASIFYDDQVPEGGGWHVRVNGRNGVRVNNVLLKRGTRQQITSGTILEIASTQMMFVTANDPVQIASYFIDQAKNMVTGEEVSAALPPPEPTPLTSSVYPSLAPAPPDFKRAVTPPLMDGRNQRGVFDSKLAMSPIYGRGMMLESTQEIDYSRDSAKDLKPPYSYATMIAQAIFSSDEEKLTLSNIYSFIAEKFAFYRHSNSGWQNSIRHNLSLNKAFQKVPRRTDEPGKGMKWQIAPEFRAEYYKKQAKRSAGSAPSSPASSKEVNPNFRGPNGQNLGYDTSMVSSFSTKDGAPRQNHTWHVNPQQPGYPPPPAYQIPPGQSDATSTPVRRRTDGSLLPSDAQPFPDSPMNPLPPNGQHHAQTYTLPSALHDPRSPPGPGANHNPTLSSSYLDTPFNNQHSMSASLTSQNTLVTPAPLRQIPRLAPPSTLVAPSKFMPESSPAGPGLFWKGIMGVTPGQPVQDMSPVKTEPVNRINGAGIDRTVMSSSPPLGDMDGIGSPSKPGRGSQVPPPSSASRDDGKAEITTENDDPKDRDGDSAMRSRSASTNANALHTNSGRPSLGPPANFNLSSNTNAKGQGPAQDDDDDNGGFDLAKGFAPIASGIRRTGSASILGR